MALCVMGALIQAGMKPRVYSATARTASPPLWRVARAWRGAFSRQHSTWLATEIELIRGSPVAARAVDKPSWPIATAARLAPPGRSPGAAAVAGGE
jgi:uncharacterized protein involved in exopolysaccharide biosynthesis